MNSLPENSLVVSIAAPVKLMSNSACCFPQFPRPAPHSIFSQIYCKFRSFCVDNYPFDSVHPSYKYRQNSDFWYLTGFAEPDSAVILGPYGYVSSVFSTFIVALISREGRLS